MSSGVIYKIMNVISQTIPKEKTNIKESEYSLALANGMLSYHSSNRNVSGIIPQDKATGI